MTNYTYVIKILEKQWPFPFVLRTDTAKATGNVYTWQAIKALDEKGEGPTERFKLGNKVAYSRESFFQWFASRMS